MSGLADIWIAVLSGALFCILVGLAIASVRGPLIVWLRKVQPELRATVLLALLGTPLIAALAIATLIALSSHGTAIDLVPHHCHASANDCVPHSPAVSTLALSVTAGGVLTAGSLWMASTLGVGIARTSRGVRLLRRASGPRSGATEHVLDTDALVALASGLIRSRLFLSRGLLARLDAREVDIVRVHEKAHARRFDNLQRLLAPVFALGHLPTSVRALRGELVLAQEQACDRAAADCFGAVETAETLLKVERLRGGLPARPCWGAAFVDAPVTARVKALVAPDFAPARRSVAWFGSSLLAAAAGVLIAAEPLHHEIETLILALQG